MDAVKTPFPSAVIVSIVCDSAVEFTSSRKYSSCTAVRFAVEEKVAFTVTACPARMIVAASLDCTADFAMTTGFGTERVTACAAPGVGPVSGDASQFAGSFEFPATLTRWSERPLY